MLADDAIDCVSKPIWSVSSTREFDGTDEVAALALGEKFTLSRTFSPVSTVAHLGDAGSMLKAEEAALRRAFKRFKSPDAVF